MIMTPQPPDRLPFGDNCPDRKPLIRVVIYLIIGLVAAVGLIIWKHFGHGGSL